MKYKLAPYLNRPMHLLAVLLMFLSFSTSAQQDAQYTQYMYNTVSVNPGYTGSRGHLSIAALYRAQWVGLEGAPSRGVRRARADPGPRHAGPRG